MGGVRMRKEEKDFSVRLEDKMKFKIKCGLWHALVVVKIQVSLLGLNRYQVKAVLCDKYKFVCVCPCDLLL